MGASDWSVRPAQDYDHEWIEAGLIADLAVNSYFHGVNLSVLETVARRTVEAGWRCLVVEPAEGQEQGDYPTGWVLYHPVPTLSIALAYVEPSYRGLGAWRALRAAIGLQRDQLVNVVLAGPAAMKHARSKYKAKHNWGRVIEWLT